MALRIMFFVWRSVNPRTFPCMTAKVEADDSWLSVENRGSIFAFVEIILGAV